MREPAFHNILPSRHRAEKAFIVCFVLAANWLILHAAASTQSDRFHELHGPLLDMKSFPISWLSSPNADTGSNLSINFHPSRFEYEELRWVSLLATSATVVDAAGASHRIVFGGHRTPLFFAVSGSRCGGSFSVDLPFQQLTPSALDGQLDVQVNARSSGAGYVASVLNSSGDVALDKLILASLDKCIGDPKTRIGGAKQSVLNIQYAWKVNEGLVCTRCVY